MPAFVAIRSGMTDVGLPFLAPPPGLGSSFGYVVHSVIDHIQQLMTGGEVVGDLARFADISDEDFGPTSGSSSEGTAEEEWQTTMMEVDGLGKRGKPEPPETPQDAAPETPAPGTSAATSSLPPT